MARLSRWISSMKRTSRSSSPVRIAAMSPLRSITGPATVRMPTPSSFRTMKASDVLPRPGGPASRTWSSASPRPFAASSAIDSCSFTRGWPTKSASVFGRSDRSSSTSSGSSSRATTLIPGPPGNAQHFLGFSCRFPQRGAYLLLDRQALVDAGERALRVDQRPAELDERVARDEVAVRRRVGRRADLLAQLEHDALRGLLADPGDRLEARGVLERDRAAQLRRRRPGDDRERDLRAHAVDAEQVHEQVTFLRRAEAVELERVLPNVQVRLYGQLVAVAPQHRRRRLDEVADAVHVENEPRGGQARTLAAKARDHAATRFGAVA